jgi:hypothetical protein
MKRQLTRITAMILSLTIVLLSSTSAIAQTATDPNLESAISLGIGTSPSGIINLSPLSIFPPSPPCDARCAARKECVKKSKELSCEDYKIWLEGKGDFYIKSCSDIECQNP